MELGAVGRCTEELANLTMSAVVFLGALSTSPQGRFEKRIRDWYMAVEGYPRQLHEIELDQYLEMKRRESVRLAADPA